MERRLLIIEKEYGCRIYYAWLDKCELDALVRRWRSLDGLYCGVPVPMVVPQARELYLEVPEHMALACRRDALTMHMHDWDDSHFSLARDHVIGEPDYSEPGGPLFWMDDMSYTHQDIDRWWDNYRALRDYAQPS
jgi:hypothetical protein